MSIGIPLNNSGATPVPDCKAFKCQYFVDSSTGVSYYDIVNEFETNPTEIIKSKIIIRLSTIKGEWKDDLDFGVPIIAIKQNSTSPDAVAKLIADEILKVQYVTNVTINTKDIDYNTRTFTVSYSAETLYGAVNGEINI